MFYGETKYVEMVASGSDLLSLPDCSIKFSALETSLHALADYGWTLRMHQNTPLHVMKTRPKVSLHPGESRSFGFLWKLRARAPYRSAREVIADISGIKAQKFSLSKYEIKYVPITSHTGEVEKTISGLKFDRDILSKKVKELRAELVLAEKTLRRLLDESDEDVSRELQEARAKLKAWEDDPFEALRDWTDRKISELDFSKKPTPSPIPDNVIDFVEKLQQRTVELDERVLRLLEA